MCFMFAPDCFVWLEAGTRPWDQGSSTTDIAKKRAKMMLEMRYTLWCGCMPTRRSSSFSGSSWGVHVTRRRLRQ